MTERTRRRYPTDVSDEEWAFVAPYLTLMSPDAPQRTHPLRDAFDALGWLVRAGTPWRMMPNDLPPWEAVYRQTRRRMAAGAFEALVHDLRALLRLADGREVGPTSAVLDGRTMQSTVESGARAGYDGHKRRKGSKVHLESAHGRRHARAPARPEGDGGGRAGAGPGRGLGRGRAGGDRRDRRTGVRRPSYTGEQPAEAAKSRGIELCVVKHPEAKKGFVLLPRQWVVERSFAWLARFRRLARDYERLPGVLAGLHFVAFACLMLRRVIPALTGSA